MTRGQETDLPASAKITYIGAAGDYRAIGGGVAPSRRGLRPHRHGSPADRSGCRSGRLDCRELVVGNLGRARARELCPTAEPARARTGRRRRCRRCRRARIICGSPRSVSTARAISTRAGPTLRSTVRALGRRELPRPPTAIVDRYTASFLSRSAGARESDPAHGGFIAAAQEPWPGPLALYRSPDGTAFALNTVLATPATTGVTTTLLASGPQSRLDHATTLTVELDRGALTSVSDLQLLAGANLCAIEVAPDVWEVLQFETATLLGPSTYSLSKLLRAQRGSDDALGASGSGRRALCPASTARLHRSTCRATTRPSRSPGNWGPPPATSAMPSYRTDTHRFRGRGLLAAQSRAHPRHAQQHGRHHLELDPPHAHRRR